MNNIRLFQFNHQGQKNSFNNLQIKFHIEMLSMVKNLEHSMIFFWNINGNL